jgi:hypothetical protein
MVYVEGTGIDVNGEGLTQCRRDERSREGCKALAIWRAAVQSERLNGCATLNMDGMS